MAVNIKNKKASYTYFLTDEFTAGLVLSGSAVSNMVGMINVNVMLVRGSNDLLGW